jgi:hypothetical protein
LAVFPDAVFDGGAASSRAFLTRATLLMESSQTAVGYDATLLSIAASAASAFAAAAAFATYAESIAKRAPANGFPSGDGGVTWIAAGAVVTSAAAASDEDAGAADAVVAGGGADGIGAALGGGVSDPPQAVMTAARQMNFE